MVDAQNRALFEKLMALNRSFKDPSRGHFEVPKQSAIITLAGREDPAEVGTVD